MLTAASALFVACAPTVSPGLAPLAEQPASPVATSLGEALYLRECAACHGARGEGQADWMIANPDGTLPAPPHDASGHTWHHSDAELTDIISQGGVIYMDNSTMPGYADRLTPEEIVAILDHIKTLWGPRERAYQAERTLDWEFMHAARD